MRDSELYKRVIDQMVKACLDGQGQVGAERARRGLWNQNATAERMPEQHAINDYLARSSAQDRELLAGMLADSFRSGVFSALVVLHGEAATPFDVGYAGSPYEDFTGRIDDPARPWPEGPPPDD